MNLQTGNMGAEVRNLQNILVGLGYNITVDGIFGPLTKDAVISFQQTHKDENGMDLVVDGIVGVKTWRALEATGAGAGKQITDPSPHPMIWIALALVAIGGYYFLYR